MLSDYARSLLRSGIIEAKAGEKAAAQRYLERALIAADDHDLLAEAWYWMSVVAADPSEQRKALENALAHDLTHARARRALAVLDGKLKPDEIVNPDALPPPADELTRADARRFMCPKCGARMVYAPHGQSLVCEYCARREALGPESQPAEEQDFIIAMATVRGHGRPSATQVFHCQGCGAEFLLPPGVLSAVCAYCASPHVVALEESRELIAPDGIIPHACDRRRATRLLVDWVEGNGITPQSKVEPPRGLYAPIWVFDVGGGIDYSGEVIEAQVGFGEAGAKTVRVRDRYPVQVDDLPIPASRKLSRRLARLLPGFDLTAVKPYDPRYLANWMAEVYDVPMADASLDARSQTYVRYRRDLPTRLAPITNLRTSSASLSVASFQLVLLPLWMTEVPFAGRDHLVLINGQTGTVDGDTPHKPLPGWMEWLADLFEDET